MTWCCLGNDVLLFLYQFLYFRMLTENFNFTALNIVKRAYNQKLSALHCFPEDGTPFTKHFDLVKNVVSCTGLDHFLPCLSRCGLCLLDSGTDRLHQRRDIALIAAAGAGSDNGTALRMTEYDAKRCTEMSNSVFNGTKPMLADKITGNADTENIADSLIENDIKRYAGIAA